MQNKLKTFLIVNTVCFSLFFLNTEPVYGENAEIVVSGQVKGVINPLIFGNNMIAYDPTTIEDWTKYYIGYSNYGAGIWNPQSGRSVSEVIRLAKEAGMTIARFPGGGGSSFYDWKKTIGPQQSRPNFLYGLDEFLKTCEEIGCEVIFTLSYRKGTPQDAADLVEYLNASGDGSNIGGGIDWARKRVENGHASPYKIKFFELGNEVYQGVPKKEIPGADPEQYARDFLLYKKAMKAVDASILLGSVINSGQNKGLSQWNERMFMIAGDSIDFLIEHTYRPWYTSDDEKVNPDKLFADTLGSLDEVDVYYKNLSRHFEMVTDRKNIPIAVTEYNGGFVQDKPVPFRHSLGTALFNAGLLQIFMKPENNILLANYWQYVNSYWGMIKNDKFMEGKGTYIKRPNYYTFEMFHKHFGTELLDVTVADASALIGAGIDNNLLSGINWKIESVSGANIKTVNDEVEVSFTGESDLNFYHVTKKVALKPNTTYLISGFVRAIDLEDNEGVCLEIQDSRGWTETHSAAATGRVFGTTDWLYVETEYTTLNDATDVSVIVRRISGKGLVKGNAFVRDVKLIEKPDERPKGKDALSISSSRSKDGDVIYLMVLNKSVYEDMDSTILLKGFNSAEDVNVWTLTGPSVWATNEQDPDNVNIKHKIVKIKNGEIDYIFPSHSLTSIAFRKLDLQSPYPSAPVNLR